MQNVSLVVELTNILLQKGNFKAFTFFCRKFDLVAIYAFLA